VVYVPNNTASVYRVEFSKKEKKYVAYHSLFVSWLNDGDLLRVEWEPPKPIKNPHINLLKVGVLITLANSLQWDHSRDETLAMIRGLDNLIDEIRLSINDPEGNKADNPNKATLPKPISFVDGRIER